MYLHLGNETVVRTDHIIGIFDIENASISKFTKEFLRHCSKRGEVITVSYEMPKSFIVCEADGTMVSYISQISAQTLLKRSQSRMK